MTLVPAAGWPGGLELWTSSRRAIVTLGAGTILLGGLALFTRTGPTGSWLTGAAGVIAPLTATLAAHSARRSARPGARATWWAVGVACLLAAVSRASAVGGLDDVSRVASIAFHATLAVGAILALRPARDRRLAIEIGLDGLLVLLSAAVLVIRLQLDAALAEGWLSVGDGFALLVGQISVVGSLLFCALLVLWRDAELGALSIDLLFVAALLFSFGDALGATWLTSPPDRTAWIFELLRLGGWAALISTAVTAWHDPGPTLTTSGRRAVARSMRLLVIPAAVLFLAAWAVHTGDRGPSALARAATAGLGVVLAVRVGAAIYGGERDAEERQAADARAARARIRAITAQMNPHFLFNALHSISALLRRDAGAAESVLERLGGLLRYGLDRGDRLLPLEEEWRFTRSYLELEQIRLGERLVVAWELEPEALEWIVPPFILQPLVENAIRHAVDVSSEGGRVRIRARVEEGERLRVEVADSGEGADLDAMWAAKGVGVRGVRAQLESHFGQRARMEAERVDDGFVVRLILPALDD